MKVKITYIDVCIGSYLLWGILNMLFISHLPFNNILVWKWSVIAGIYMAMRVFSRKNWILWGVVLFGIVQAFCAIGQQIGYIASNHNLFDVTGFMGNPGQLGGFQAFALVVVFMLLKKNTNYQLRICVIPAALLIGYSLWLADSRAGWLAFMVGFFILYWSNIVRVLRQHKWLYILAVILMIGLPIQLFNYRSDSVMARLLIWRVSADMVADNPIAGLGVGQFNQHYILYQADYFKQNPDSDFLMVADNAAYPYNEILHVLIEQGVIGLIALGALIVVGCLMATDKTLLAPFVAMLVFSCFSYPSYKLGLLALFPISLGVIGSKKSLEMHGRWAYIGTIGLWGVTSFAIITGWNLSHEARRSSRQLMQSYDKRSAEFVTEQFDRLYVDARFNTMYLLAMMKYPHEMADETRFCHIIPTCENWCDIGDYYAEQGAFHQAEEYYRIAALMIPTRLTPNYRLWKLYLQQGRGDEAGKIALHILNQPLKVENTFTIRVKNEVRKKLGDF